MCPVAFFATVSLGCARTTRFFILMGVVVTRKVSLIWRYASCRIGAVLLDSLLNHGCIVHCC